jgi:chaperone BCS1
MPPFLEHLFHGIPTWALLVLGGLAGSLKTVWGFLYDHTIGYLINLVSVNLSVEDTEHRDAYIWMSHWIENHLRKRGISSLLLRRSVATRNNSDPNASDADYTLIPHYGTYYMMFDGKPMVITHWRDDTTQTPGMRKMHSFEVQLWFSRKRKVLLDLLEQAKREYLASLPKSMQFYQWSARDWDWASMPIALRPLDTLYLPDGFMSDILADAKFFLNNRAMYRELGIPYRRGYLLEGPPGTGKTSAIIGIASELGIPMYTINLNDTNMTGEMLISRMNSCAKPSIISFEDVDCLRMTTDRSKDSEGLTLGDVLNALDGIGASEERVLVLTTNHPEKLDPALVRSGRIDRRFHIGYAADAELRTFYDRVAKMRVLPPWQDFRARLPEETTIADAQALVLQGDNTLASDTPLFEEIDALVAD